MRILVAFLLTSFWIGATAIPARAQEGPATNLDLDACVRIAASHATEVLKSQNDVGLSGEDLLRSYAQFLPTIDAGASATYGWGNQYYTFTTPVLVNAKSLSAQYQLSTTLNLFNGLADISQFDAAVLRRDAAQMTLQWAKQQVATDITQSYYQILLDRRILEIDQKNLQVMLSREKLLKTELQVGNASIADVAQQSSQTALASSIVISAQQKLKDDQILLVQKLRLDPTGQYQFADFDPSTGVRSSLIPEHEMLTNALDLRPDLKASLWLSKRNDYEVDVARSDYYPKLNLGFTLMGNGATLYSQSIDGVNQGPISQESLFPQLGNQINYAATLTLSWNILDHGLTRYSVAQAQVARENSEIDYEDTRIAVTSQIRQVQGDFESAQSALDAVQRATLAAQKAYAVISGRYRVGASSFIDLITAQATLVQAQSTEAQSRIALAFESKLVDFYQGKTAVP